MEMSSHPVDESSMVPMYDLLVESRDIGELLQEVVSTTAESLSAGTGKMGCAIMLLRPKRPITVASSDPVAQMMDEVQYHSGDGPCLTAAREDRMVYLPDTRSETRWPDYRQAALDAGILSAIGLPLDLGQEAVAALNVYADHPEAFDGSTLGVVQQHAVNLAASLRLAVRLARHRDIENDLKSALASRTDIDLAVGIIMGQHRCSQGQAVEILRQESNRRNVKMRALATDIVRQVGRGPASTHFED
jgi:GAF domain-containing protein